MRHRAKRRRGRNHLTASGRDIRSGLKLAAGITEGQDAFSKEGWKRRKKHKGSVSMPGGRRAANSIEKVRIEGNKIIFTNNSGKEIIWINQTSKDIDVTKRLFILLKMQHQRFQKKHRI